MSDAYDPFDNLAVDRTIGSLEEPPEDAARAIELGQKTGANPVAIHADLEEFESNAKAATTAQLIRGNRLISDYINSHPLAGIVSNGDLHKLDEASQKMKLLPKGRSRVEKDFGETAGSLAAQWGQDLFDALWESGKSLTSIPKDITSYTIPSDEVRNAAELMRKEGPSFHNITAFLGTLNNLFVTQLASGSPLDLAAQYKPVNLGAQDLVGGLVGAFGAVTGITPSVRLFARVGEEVTTVPYEFSEQVAMLGMMFMGIRQGKGKAHVQGGEPPPVGISKEADSIREHRSKENLRALDEATKAVQSSQTNQLAPELAREFVRQHVEDRSIYVSVDAVRRLYGEKLPKHDDGILGWVDKLSEQIEAQREVGGDIAIPLKDWLTKVDPEVAKILHDDMRVLRDDISVNDALRLKEHEKAMEAAKQPELERIKQQIDELSEQAIAEFDKAVEAERRGDVEAFENAKARARALDERIQALVEQWRKIQPDEVAKFTTGIHDEPPKPALAPTDLSRRGFLKGVGATVATAATGKVGKIGEVVNPFAGADLSMFNKNVEHLAASYWSFFKKFYPEKDTRAAVLDEIRRFTTHWEKSGYEIDKKFYEAINDLVDSGWTPSKELVESMDKTGRGEGIKPSEMTRKMVQEDHLRPSEAQELSSLPWPEEYMKGDYPKGLIEHGPREVMRRHQEAIDESREAAKLRPALMPGKLRLELEAVFDQPAFEDQAGGKHKAGKLHDIKVIDETGNKIGDISLLKEDDLLYVDYTANTTHAPWQHGINQLGILYRVARELHLMFPDVKRVGGYLVSRDKYVERPISDFILPEPSRISAGEIEGKPQPAIKLGPARSTGIMQTSEGKRFTTDSVGSLTIREAVAQINFSETIGGPIGGALDAIARKVVEKAGSVQIHIIKDAEWKAMMEGKEAHGQYDPISNTVAIRESEYRSPSFERTLLHEIVHAATLREIVRNPELEARILRLMREVSIDAKSFGEYGLTHPSEFIAEAIGNPDFQRKLTEIKITPELAKELGVREHGLVKTLWDTLIHLIAKAFKLETDPTTVTALEAALRVSQESFDYQLTIRDRIKLLAWKTALTQAEEVPRPALMAKQLKLPGLTRMEDRPALEPTAVGINKEWYQRYQELIAKQQGEDAKRRMEIAIKRAEQIQTKEWEDAQDRISKEVEDQIRARPDVAVDEALRKGTLGEGTAQPGGRRLRLKADELTEEQKGVLNRSEYSLDGIHPDDLAGFYGYPSGDAILQRLGQFRTFVKETYASSEAFIKAAAREETARRMEQEFGDLGAKILEEARDHVTSETQLDLLHEELVGLAMQAKIELTITKDQMKQMAKDAFDKHTMAHMTMSEYLRLAGKHGIELEKAMLGEDWKTAFKAKQAQTFATMMATEAKKIERAKGVWDRNAKRFAKREVKGIDQRYTNAIHDIMFRTGSTPKPRRSLGDLAEAFRRDGWSDLTPLRDFVVDRMEAFRELAVPDWLMDPRFQKDFDSLTVKEFREAHDAMRSLIKNGRDEQRVFSQGEAADLHSVFDGMLEQIKDLPIQEDRIDRPEGRIRQWIGTTFWAHVNLESMMNRLDRGDNRGLFKKYIMRPIAEASNAKDAMMKKYQGQVAALGRIKGMDKLVENNLFIDPRGDGKPFIMRRRNVLGVLQNVGNASNLEKLAKGYGVEPTEIMQWLRRNTTKEDWNRAQKIGDIFDDLFDQAGRMQHELTGIAPVKVPLTPFIDPFGIVRRGWYNPVKYDRKRPGDSPRLIGRSAIEEEGYFRATTPTGFLQERTGYIAPMELNLDIVPIRMRQMIHDISMRPAVIQASKFFYNPQFNRMLREHYGDKPVEEFVPFLRDVANSPNFVSYAEQVGNQAMEFFRQNLISTLIGLNPGTVMKHGTTALLNSLQQMGYRDFAKEFAQIMRVDSTTGQRNWTMALEKSEELQRRIRNFKELIAGHGVEINLRGSRGGTRFDTAREIMMQMGAMPVATSDLLSSVPTWLVAYKRAKMAGKTEGESIYLGDLAVRQTHGSSVMSNKPSIMRTNSFGALYTSLYGFFSHMFQKQYEMAWKAKDTLGLVKEGEYAVATKRIPELASLFLSYVILPAIIEELVTPYTNSERDSWGAKAAKTLAFGVSSSVIGVRDFVHAFINVRDPQAGLAGTMFKTISDVGRDLGRGAKAFNDPARQAQLMHHVIAMFGLLTGLTNASEGKMVEYAWRVNKRLERPKGPWEVAVGLRYGKTKGHSKTLNEYMKHLQGH